MEKFFEVLSTIIGVVGTVILTLIFIIGIGSVITWWAWNNFMPTVFHLPTITLWQAFAFNLLTNSFRGFNANFKNNK